MDVLAQGCPAKGIRLHIHLRNRGIQMKFEWTLCVLVSFALSGIAQAQVSATPNAPAVVASASTAPTVASPPASASASVSTCCTVLAGTLIEVALAEPLSSRTQKRGDKFRLQLTTPVIVDGVTVLPQGIEGVGEIIDAAPSRAGGAPGKLLLAGRYLSWNGTQIPLRGLKLGGSGKNHSNASMAVALVAGPFGMFVHGGNIELPIGTQAEAKFATDTPLVPIVSTQTPPSSNTATNQE
jgi:hypothetical protein